MTNFNGRQEVVFTKLEEAVDFWNKIPGAILEYFYGRYVVSYYES